MKKKNIVLLDCHSHEPVTGYLLSFNICNILTQQEQIVSPNTNGKKMNSEENEGPQCQYFVLRKKRLCRMTVKPGRQYCGEHEPNIDKDDSRIPCPNDPKHTCFASKLEKHLKICNARERDVPEYIIRNINLGADGATGPRRPLTEVPLKTIMDVIVKINLLYDKYLKDNISTFLLNSIHPTVMEEFSEAGRSESSLRHLRQVSSLLQLVEEEGLVQPGTCYVDLGAGKGQLGAYAWNAWGGADGSGGEVVLLERAALRHKRDRRARVTRLRHDLAHVALGRLPAARRAPALVGLAKHLCGAATDMALRCLSAADVAGKVSGLAMATCCHHRCERAHYVAGRALQEHDINTEDFEVILGVVSWATCGDGLSRERRARGEIDGGRGPLNAGERAEVGRRAKALVDWGRVQFLRERGFEARLVYFVPPDVSPENLCIVASSGARPALAKPDTGER